MRACLTYTAFVALLLMGQLAHAIGLGDAQLRSHFGSPLDLSIPVHHAAGLTGDDFRIALTAMNDAVSGSPLDTMVGSKYQVSYDPETESVRLRSDEAIVEPYLAFTLVLRWPQGFLKRDYTVLLEFPEFHRTKPVTPVAESTGAAAVVKTSAGKSTVTNLDPAQRDLAAPKQQQEAVAERPTAVIEPGHYRVQRGDSLWGLANDLSRQHKGNRAQWMASLFQKNPKAFMGGQPGRLKEAYLLFVPAICSDTRMVLSDSFSNGYRLVDDSELPAMPEVAEREAAPAEVAPELAQPTQSAEAGSAPMPMDEQGESSVPEDSALAAEASTVDEDAMIAAEPAPAAEQDATVSASQVEQALQRVEELERQLATALALMAQQEQYAQQAEAAEPRVELPPAHVFTGTPLPADMSAPAYFLHSIGWLSVGMLLVFGYMLYRDRRDSRIRLRRIR